MYYDSDFVMFTMYYVYQMIGKNGVIHDFYCSKFELYPLSFQHEISNNNLLIAAPYGGSIAVTRNPKKLVKVQGATKPVILLYTSSGKLTAKLQVRFPCFSTVAERMTYVTLM